MQARAGDADGRVAEAAAGYAQALTAAPTDGDVALRAYRAGLAAGDDALVRRAVAVLGDKAPADAALVALSDAARTGDVAGFDAAIARLDGGLLTILAPSLRGWSGHAHGLDPLPRLAAEAKAGAIAGQLADETRALLTIARGDAAGGIALVTTLRAAGAPIDLRLAAAQLLFGSGHDDAARALLSGDDPMVAVLRQGAPAKPTLAFGTSRLLVRIATDLMNDGPADLSIALSRAALRADPADDRARLLLAAALSRDGAPDQALAVLGEIGPNSAAAASAAGGRITVLATANRADESLAAAKVAAERSDATVADWQRYADRLVAALRYKDAAGWYRRVIDAGSGADWAAWLQYGGALDNADEWKAAKRAVERAVALAPDQPLALNYLGYAKVERGEDVRGATRLLERASILKPDDSSITDSLGWAYFLGGDTVRALPLVERAATRDPVNAEIGEHLGDIYWRLGRRYEARYAWSAARLTADAPGAARLATRLRQGPPKR